jgi:hypothetical protein
LGWPAAISRVGFYFLHCYLQKEKRIKTTGVQSKEDERGGRKIKKKLGLHGITCCTRARLVTRYFFFFFGCGGFFFGWDRIGACTSMWVGGWMERKGKERAGVEFPSY